MTTYKQLKQGQAFAFIEGGVVYVRCRGGYRPGRGGPLVKFNYAEMPVYPLASQMWEAA